MKHCNFVLGFLCGAVLFSGTMAAAAGISATQSQQPIYLDGQQVSMTAYSIGGNNYVKLRDIGKEIGFNVYWQNGVQIDSDTPYTGEAPSAAVTEEKPVSSAVDVSAIRQEIVKLTNALRAENGLSALTVDEQLMQAAQVRAEEMAATTTYAHTRPDGSKYSTVTDCPYVAENINRISLLYLTQQNKELAQATVDSWAHSDGHLANMLNTKPVSIGVGIAKGVNDSGKDAWYCVQLFLYRGYTISYVSNPITT